jgi:hypothetical protein
MQSDKANTLTEDQAAILILIFATIIGSLLRVAFPLLSSFPLNDGGLFYAMIRDLQNSHYALPIFTTYNHAQIPFAYPPLAFYAAGLLSDLTHFDLLIILRLIPPIVSAAAIPVFYLLAKEFLPAKISAAMAALLFAFAQRIFAWQIMGGGITRSFGFLFALLTIYYTTKLLSTHAARFIPWTSIWGALTILTHPEAIPQTALAVLIIYLFRDRSGKGLLLSLASTSVILLLTAPWWITVLRAHGIAPYLGIWSAANSNSNPLLARPVALFQFLITEEPFLPFLAFLGLIGTFKNLARREYFLPLWMVLPYLLDPRSGPLYVMIALLILAVQGLLEIILPALSNLKNEGNDFFTLLKSGGIKSFLLFILIYLLVAGYFSAAKIFGRATLTRSGTEAMAWIRGNTSSDAAFLVITGGQPLLDPASDWFPALTERISLGTVFGYEWVNDNQFAQRVTRYETLQECREQTIDCIESWSIENKIEFTHVYIQSNGDFFPLQMDLQNSPDYKQQYLDDGIWIFEKAEN